jgi:hypothetical protein
MLIVAGILVIIAGGVLFMLSEHWFQAPGRAKVLGLLFMLVSLLVIAAGFGLMVIDGLHYIR